MAGARTAEGLDVRMPAAFKRNGAVGHTIETPMGESPESDIVVLSEHDLRRVMASLRRVTSKTVENDEALLGAATDFFVSIKTFLEDLQAMPEPKMGLLAPPQAKIDVAPCLLAARALQNVATEYALTYPVRSQADVAKRHLAANFADVTESFLLVSKNNGGEQLLTKDKAGMLTGMIVEAKVAMRHLLTQYSMVSLQIAGVEDD